MFIQIILLVKQKGIGFIMRGCFGNMCTLYLLCFVSFVLCFLYCLVYVYLFLFVFSVLV
jgi:hypothetical protein